jgi:copper transport protein
VITSARRRRGGFALLIAVIGAAALPLTASAHALPQSAVPPEGSAVQQAPKIVVITFGENPDPQLSGITVVDGSGANVDAGPTTPVPGKPLALGVPLKPIGKGVYTVTWKTVSAVDGHLATGSYAFGVDVSPGSVHAPPPAAAAAPSVAAVLLRLLLFTGLVVSFGAVMLGLFAYGAPTLILRRVIAAGAVITVAGTVGVVAAQAIATGATFLALFGSSIGRSLIARGIPALILLACGVLLLRGRRTRLLSVIAGAAALGGMAVDALSSHAGSENPVTLNEFAQWLHIAAVGLWIGGLVALLVSIMGAPSDGKAHLTRRLSTLAGIGLVVVAATGVFRAVIEVQTWSNLVTTVFGIFVLLKVGLIVILAALGAFNRFRNVPRLPRALRSLRRVVSTELVVALGALTVAAALVNVAPPAEYAAAAAQAQQATPLVVSGNDFATTVRVRLTVTPGTPGFNQFNLRVTDYDTGATISVHSAVLQFTQPLRPQLATSTLTLKRHADGSLQASGGNLSVAGIWEVAATIQHGQQSAEVHLQLATNGPAPSVTVQPFSGGLPTLYTIQLGKGRTAQVYIDPDKPGADIFHVTFFTSNGSELRVPQVTIGMTPPGGSPTILVSRPFDPIGHFVADANVPPGKTRFDLIATLPDGEVLSTYVVVTPG